MPLCPVCHVGMVAVEEADVRAATCPECHGTWISTLALKRRTQFETTPNQPHMALAPLADLADQVSHSDSKQALNCPNCRNEMTKDRFHPKIPVQIDVCASCQYIWLDGGEQGLLLRLYKELVATQGLQGPAQQANLNRMNQMQAPAPASSGLDTAVNVGCAVLGVLVDVLLMPSHSGSHYGWHSSSRW